MSFDTHIEFMILTAASDTWLHPFVEQLLEQYQSALLHTVVGGYSADQMDRMGKVAREHLRTGLCDLLNAAQRATGQDRFNVPPAGDPTQ